MSEQPATVIRSERSHKRVRAYLGADLVADTKAPLLVWEHDKYPAYYIPAADVVAELIPAGLTDRLPRLGVEEEPVYVHPRDPYKRVDILASSRRVRVELDGVTVAESSQPRVLFETGLPPRHYLPLADLRMDLLRPSDRSSQCPYKGTAAYWSVDTSAAAEAGRLHTDVVWIYRSPLPESQKIAGLACFFNERVDLRVDGELLPRPKTPFS
jgi:uncharacterized protein (DUF427 family)